MGLIASNPPTFIRSVGASHPCGTVSTAYATHQGRAQTGLCRSFRLWLSLLLPAAAVAALTLHYDYRSTCTFFLQSVSLVAVLRSRP